MSMRKLEKSEWQNYMDRVSKYLPTTDVTIEVEGLDIGDQIEADHLPLLGITYDRHDRSLRIATEALHHSITGPAEIWVEEEGGALRSLSVMDDGGHKQIVRLDRALALPAA